MEKNEKDEKGKKARRTTHSTGSTSLREVYPEYRKLLEAFESYRRGVTSLLKPVEEQLKTLEKALSSELSKQQTAGGHPTPGGAKKRPAAHVDLTNEARIIKKARLVVASGSPSTSTAGRVPVCKRCRRRNEILTKLPCCGTHWCHKCIRARLRPREKIPIPDRNMDKRSEHYDQARLFDCQRCKRVCGVPWDFRGTRATGQTMHLSERTRRDFPMFVVPRGQAEYRETTTPEPDSDNPATF